MKTPEELALQGQMKALRRAKELLGNNGWIDKALDKELDNTHAELTKLNLDKQFKSIFGEPK